MVAHDQYYRENSDINLDFCTFRQLPAWAYAVPTRSSGYAFYGESSISNTLHLSCYLTRTRIPLSNQPRSKRWSRKITYCSFKQSIQDEEQNKSKHRQRTRWKWITQKTRSLVLWLKSDPFTTDEHRIIWICFHTELNLHEEPKWKWNLGTISSELHLLKNNTEAEATKNGARHKMTNKWTNMGQIMLVIRFDDKLNIQLILKGWLKTNGIIPQFNGGVGSKED